MKNLLHIEEAFMLGLAIYLNSFLPFCRMVFLGAVLFTDIGMVGLHGEYAGRRCYLQPVSVTKGLLLLFIWLGIFSSFTN
ncbi:MAG: hypothetical protein U5K54_08000 [Cytophagales bacterium]|nr:hypothetical protein [Cytophagales bacterium]